MAELISLGDDKSFAVQDACEARYENLVKSKKRKGGDVVAIFVHAGAGYHSITNEHVHLKACGDACQVAMSFLRAGSTAVEAVEAAVRVLEDNDITNAGYGSNLSLDGTVECDASIVDHYGRSGAVGAVGQVMHPIHVARLILEGTVHRMTLRRVPPNLLVGQGATDFAYENKVPILPPDALVSPAARERFRRWQQDLFEAAVADSHKATSTPEKRFLAPLANEAQPPTPALLTSPAKSDDLTSNSYLTQHGSPSQRASCGSPEGRSTRDSAQPDADTGGSESRQESVIMASEDHDKMGLDPAPMPSPSLFESHVGADGTAEFERPSSRQPGYFLKLKKARTPTTDKAPALEPRMAQLRVEGSKGPQDSDSTVDPRPDSITDTVGAIAIDSFGRIAAASSSGGIGMKHKGRTGPAALVGIGTAVHPVLDGDRECKTTATVTSGTGEHMATTLAAGTCADRLYHGQKLASDGSFSDADDEEALANFVRDGFMAHPSVRHSNTAAAIGVLGVKKTTDGLWFHFAHNTDSFAICSMTSEDEEPMAVMSRATRHNDNSHVSTGGRSCTWYPGKSDTKDVKRRKKAAQREERNADKQGISNRARSRILHALRPSNPAGTEPTSGTDEGKQRS